MPESNEMQAFRKDLQYYRFCLYGLLKNLKFFEPFLILFLLDKGLTYLQIGVVYTTREITLNVFEMPAGLAADVLGRRRTMIFSFSVYILSFLIYSLAPGLAGILLATVFFGLGDSFRTGTHKAMIFDYLERKGWAGQRISYYGHTRSWSQAGSALSALGAAGLVFWSGKIGQIFLYSVIPYTLGLLLMLGYPACLDGKGVKPGKVRFRKAMRDVALTFWSAFRTPKILKGILNVSVFGGYYRALKDYAQPVIQAFAISLPVLLSLDQESRVAMLIGAVYFLIYALSSFVTRRSAWLGSIFKGYAVPLNLTLLAGFSMGALCGFTLLRDLPLIAILLFISIYLVENLRLPAGLSYFTENVDGDILATILSAESQGKSLISGVIALIMGFLADRYGIGHGMLLVSVLMILSSPLFLVRDSSGKG